MKNGNKFVLSLINGNNNIDDQDNLNIFFI
ncbi:MAG: hypothetical protein KatS3mg094_580 [Candidatus Parcubacteria bacterium]|nr:MAG: hypothetical protein KatS3mg094_580 [Candidatus Parcubacteria bacterium]